MTMPIYDGIYVNPFPPEQTARILGTGIEVFEVYKIYLNLERDWSRLRQAFDWLAEAQLQAALAYAAGHPEAMQARLEAEAAAYADALQEEYALRRNGQ